MIKKLLIVGAVAVVGFTTFTAFEEKTDEQIIAEKLEAKKAEFSAAKQVECDERANTMALGMVDSLVAVKKAAMAPVSGTKPVTKPKGSTKPSTKPAPAPVPATKPAPATTEEKVKSKTSGGNVEQTKQDVKTKTSGGNVEETKQKVKSKTSGGGGGR